MSYSRLISRVTTPLKVDPFTGNTWVQAWDGSKDTGETVIDASGINIATIRTLIVAAVSVSDTIAVVCYKRLSDNNTVANVVQLNSNNTLTVGATITVESNTAQNFVQMVGISANKILIRTFTAVGGSIYRTYTISGTTLTLDASATTALLTLGGGTSGNIQMFSSTRGMAFGQSSAGTNPACGLGFTVGTGTFTFDAAISSLGGTSSINFFYQSALVPTNSTTMYSFFSSAILTGRYAIFTDLGASLSNTGLNIYDLPAVMSPSQMVPQCGFATNNGSRIIVTSHILDNATPQAFSGRPMYIESIPNIVAATYQPQRGYSGGNCINGLVPMVLESNGDTSGLISCVWHDDTQQYIGARAFTVTQANDWQWGKPVKLQTIANLNTDNRLARQMGKIVKMNEGIALAFYGGSTGFNAKILIK